MADKTFLVALALALCAAVMGQKSQDRPLTGGSVVSLSSKFTNSTPNPEIGPPPGSSSDSLPPNVRHTRSNPSALPPNPRPGSTSSSLPPNLRPTGSNPASPPPNSHPVNSSGSIPSNIRLYPK
ncbi:uncharacterized protein LOC135196865 [Macrobrachium nipponense]|uniref:uncharacterized protein LOC135196865 n=1 Tax=Macrobrachium nipponense TaxID=159736 RepID=UPI0030C81A10